MSKQIHYLDPSGNITAIVAGAKESERPRISADILSAGLAEQVAYECDCINEHSSCIGRIEMMGGEFCGNASRAYAFLKLVQEHSSGTFDVLIEMSGAASPVPVSVNLDSRTAYTDMPLPLELIDFELGGETYPLVRMEGIDHIIAEGVVADPSFAEYAIRTVCRQYNCDACGIHFIDEDYHLTPYVYVRETDSLVAESSCGSGSVAAAWYLAGRNRSLNEFLFIQPGGTISVQVSRNDEDDITNCRMGGSIAFVE